MSENRLVLTGTIVRSPKRSRSPAGIPHCEFVLEHESQQQEAELPIRVWCRIQVIASGEGLQRYTDKLNAGCNVAVTGFISRHRTPEGLGKLVLHAHHIEQV